MCQGPHKLLHPLSLLQQVAQVLVELGALQLWDEALQGLLEIAVVEELSVLKARLEHCFIAWHRKAHYSLHAGPEAKILKRGMHSGSEATVWEPRQDGQCP